MTTPFVPKATVVALPDDRVLVQRGGEIDWEIEKIDLANSGTAARLALGFDALFGGADWRTGEGGGQTAAEIVTLLSGIGTLPTSAVAGLVAALAGKVAEGDARLTDARTPTAHTHPLVDVTGAGTMAAQAAADYTPTAALLAWIAATAAHGTNGPLLGDAVRAALGADADFDDMAAGTTRAQLTAAAVRVLATPVALTYVAGVVAIPMSGAGAGYHLALELGAGQDAAELQVAALDVSEPSGAHRGLRNTQFTIEITSGDGEEKAVTVALPYRRRPGFLIPVLADETAVLTIVFAIQYDGTPIWLDAYVSELVDD